MKLHSIRVHPERDRLPKEHQLAWKIALVALDDAETPHDVAEMIVNRLVDNAAVAVAAINQPAVASARAQALAHPRDGGATLFGIAPDRRFYCEWAAWANGVAVSELDFHDTFLGAECAHPAENIPTLIAVAQQKNCAGQDLIRGIAAAYEIHVSLTKGISLHKHRIDHVAHLGVATVAGIGAMLRLEPDIVYQAIQHVLHVSTATRQVRKGQISSWKPYASAHVGKLAVETVDRAMRGETAPSPIYEGQDGLVAWMLDGPDAHYEIGLLDPGESKCAILETYAREHAAEYQSQALIDLAFKMGPNVHDWDRIRDILIYTSHHTHYVIGSGAGDPQKYDPAASRETLSNSAMYGFAIALQDGHFHSTQSYRPERAAREDTIRLWGRIRTIEDAEWTKRYHSHDPKFKAYGARAEIFYDDGGVQKDELAVANVHPSGTHPFGRADYIRKFQTLVKGLVETEEQNRYIDQVQKLATLDADGVLALNLVVPQDRLENTVPDQKGLF